MRSQEALAQIVRAAPFLTAEDRRRAAVALFPTTQPPLDPSAKYGLDAPAERVHRLLAAAFRRRGVSMGRWEQFQTTLPATQRAWWATCCRATAEEYPRKKLPLLVEYGLLYCARHSPSPCSPRTFLRTVTHKGEPLWDMVLRDLFPGYDPPWEGV